MSMRFILLDLDLFRSPGDREDSEEMILWLLEVLTDLNCKYLRKHPETPKLYNSGVVYAVPDQMAENKIRPSKLSDCTRYLKSAGASDETAEVVKAFLQGMEWFRSIPQVIKKGQVDCDNLSVWRSAELRNAGIRATPYITWRERADGTTYHALVRWPDGTSEDPSRLLGLGTEAERVEERRKNRERFDGFVAKAHQLCMDGATSPLAAGKQIDALGLLGESW